MFDNLPLRIKAGRVNHTIKRVTAIKGQYKSFRTLKVSARAADKAVVVTVARQVRDIGLGPAQVILLRAKRQLRIEAFGNKQQRFWGRRLCGVAELGVESVMTCAGRNK